MRSLLESRDSDDRAAGVITRDPTELFRRYVDSLATVDDHRLQIDLLEELVTSYVALEKRVDGLLKNTLPASVADEIKYEGGYRPRSVRCSVLFADVVGFTRMAERISNDDLVVLLDRFFRSLDHITERHRGTKIKTIGDAYMAAYGLLGGPAQHEENALAAGLEMIAAARRLTGSDGWDLQLRVGVHAGRVTAGVVGRDRMQLDIFGDNVNIAARFESAGLPGRINVSRPVYLATRHRFEFESRGEIPLKNKDDMPAYLVVGELRDGDHRGEEPR